MRIRIAVLVALLVSLISGGLVSAAGPGGVTYSSGVQVQNLSSAVATVALDFYNQDGTIAASKTYTINGNASKTFFPLNDVTAGFNGSMVISSDQDVRAINNVLGSGPGNYFESTNGFQAGNTTVKLPLIMCNNSGFNTWFNVQNTGTADAHITIAYTPGSNGASGKSETDTIKMGAAHTFDQSVGSATVNCSTLADASGKFIGAAVVTSDQPVAAVVMQLNTTNFPVLLGYGAFTGASNTAALPLVMANNSGFYTGIQVLNTETTGTATITVTYGPNLAGGFAPAPESFQLAAGKAKTIIQNAAPPANGSANNWTGQKYVGSATISSPSAKVVAIVNETKPTGNPLGSSYSGVDPAAATNNISAPLIMANNSSYSTGIQVQNVDPSSNAVVTIHYSANTAGAFAPADENFTIGPGASKTVIQNSAPPANGSANNWTGQKYIGSATITSTGGKIVAIVNQMSSTLTGDQLATNNAFNY